MPPGPARDTSWHAAFLARVTDGMSFAQVIRSLGLAERTLYNHFRDPDFRAAALRARKDAGTPPTGQQADTSWHAEFLALLRDGHSINSAARECAVSYPTVCKHFERDPGFHAQAQEACPGQRKGPRAPGRPPREGDIPRALALVTARLSVEQALWVLGIHANGFRIWLRAQPGAAEEIRVALAPQLRRPGGRYEWPVDEVDLLELCRLVASGMDLAAACGAANIPVATVKGWRRRHADVDALIVAAADDGRTHPIRPLRRLQCPGPHCGSKTGYDYGCREAPCRSSAADSVTKSREHR